MQQLSLRCAAMDLAISHTAYTSNHVDVTLLPQQVYLRARHVSTAPAIRSNHQSTMHHVPDELEEAADRGQNHALCFNMNNAADVSRVLDNLKTLQDQQVMQQPHRLQRRAQTSYAQSNTLPVTADEPIKHIGSMRILADARQELPLIRGSRVVVCRGNGLPSADRFPIPHASVSRQHAVVDVGADGVCRYVINCLFRFIV